MPAFISQFPFFLSVPAAVTTARQDPLWAGGQAAKGFRTAYPRAGRPGTDPDGGLETSEAIFVAAALLGHWGLSLLSRYHFARQFIESNTRRFVDLGIEQVQDPQLWPAIPRPARDSRSRRRDRGRL